MFDDDAPMSQREMTRRYSVALDTLGLLKTKSPERRIDDPVELREAYATLLNELRWEYAGLLKVYPRTTRRWLSGKSTDHVPPSVVTWTEALADLIEKRPRSLDFVAGVTLTGCQLIGPPGQIQEFLDDLCPPGDETAQTWINAWVATLQAVPPPDVWDKEAKALDRISPRR